MSTDTPPPPLDRQGGTTPSELGLPGGFGPLVKVLLVLLMLAAAFVLLRGRLGRLTSGKNTTQKVAEIQAAIASKDWDTAAASIRAAREEHQDDPAVMRVTTEFLDKTGAEPPLQLQLLSSLRERGLATADDALLEGRAHLRNGDLVQARAALARLPDDSAALALKAAILAEEGEGQKALAVQQEANAKASATDDPAASVRRAATAMQSPLPEARDVALADLWTMSHGQDVPALEALRLLVDRRDLKAAQAEQLLGALDKHPDHDHADHLSAVSALMRADPARRAALLTRETQPDTGRSLDETMTLARWLAFEKEPDRLMSLAPADTLLKSKELFPIVLQSMAEAGRWSDMLALFKKHNNLPMLDEGILVWKALATSHLSSKPDDAGHLLKLAITQSQATKNHSVLRAAAQTAEDLRLWDLAYAAYLVLSTEASGHELEMLEKCWSIAVTQGDLTQQLDTARRQSALRPTSAYFAKRLDYLRLLLGDEIESAIDGAVEKTTSVEVLLGAMKAYRLGDNAVMTEALRSIRDTSELTPGQRAVYAGLLAAVGETARAFQVAERITPQGLAPEEKAFLRKAL